VNPLLRSYGPWGSGAHVSYPYGRLVNDGLWHLPARAQLLDAKGNVREGVARERDAPAGFTADVLATFEREPELIDVVALHLLEHHFAPGLQEEILEAVGLELGTPVATRRRDMGFRAAVLKAYLAECCVCGFSLRLVDGLIGGSMPHTPAGMPTAERTRCRTGVTSDEPKVMHAATEALAQLSGTRGARDDAGEFLVTSTGYRFASGHRT
jgi:hypothetical protein